MQEMNVRGAEWGGRDVSKVQRILKRVNGVNLGGGQAFYFRSKRE